MTHEERTKVVDALMATVEAKVVEVIGVPVPQDLSVQDALRGVRAKLHSVLIHADGVALRWCPACGERGQSCRQGDGCRNVPGIRISVDGRAAYPDCKQCGGSGVYGFNNCGQCEFRRTQAIESKS